MIKTYYINSSQASYNDEEFAWLQTLLLSTGMIGDVNGNIGMVSSELGSPGMAVKVTAGKCLTQITKSGRTFKVVVENDADVNVLIANNVSGANRVDAIVVRVSTSLEPNVSKSNVGTIERVNGSGISALSDGAITTALGSDGWYRLANVTVPNGAVSILNGNIADTRLKVTFNDAMGFSPIFINESLANATPSLDANKLVKLESDGKMSTHFLRRKFGGDGSDGALTISSGTTNIDLAGARVFVKNYSSISITGTGALTFTNPHANGTLIIFNCKANCTITSSANPAIDLRSLGGAPDNDGSGWKCNNPSGGKSSAPYGTGAPTTPQQIADLAFSVARVTGANITDTSPLDAFFTGGGGSSAQGLSSATPGRGGGGILFRVGGNLNITSTINASGTAGSAGSGSTGSGTATCGGRGGCSLGVSNVPQYGSTASSITMRAGGGGGGSIVFLYNGTVTNSATLTVAGGTQSPSGNGMQGSDGANGYSLVAKNIEFL